MLYRFLLPFTIGVGLGSLAGCGGGAPSISPLPAAGYGLRVNISVGTTGQLFVSWPDSSGATYYNLQRSTNPNSGYTTVQACSGESANPHTLTGSAMRACRDAGLTVGTTYYYQVQPCTASGCSAFMTPASNTPLRATVRPSRCRM